MQKFRHTIKVYGGSVVVINKGLKAVSLLSLIIDSIATVLYVDGKKLKVMSINT